MRRGSVERPTWWCLTATYRQAGRAGDRTQIGSRHCVRRSGWYPGRTGQSPVPPGYQRKSSGEKPVLPLLCRPTLRHQVEEVPYRLLIRAAILCSQLTSATVELGRHLGALLRRTTRSFKGFGEEFQVHEVCRAAPTFAVSRCCRRLAGHWAALLIQAPLLTAGSKVMGLDRLRKAVLPYA